MFNSQNKSRILARFSQYSNAFILCLLLLASSLVLAKAERDLFSMSLEELLELRVDITSNKLKTVRDQPGTVSIITQEQIARSGARNLMQLLKQIPGFWHGTDTIGTFSVSFRGIWGMEAKILLIIDGIEQNELSFGTLVLGQRYPTSTIQQVEIIRGPGSVKYGGQAALAVIKVTSKGADQDSTQVTMTTDLSKNNHHNSNYALVSGGFIDPQKKKLRYSFSGSFGHGDYSDKTWTGLDGYSFNMANRSNSEPANLNFSLINDRQKIRVIYDRFKQEDQLLFGDSGLFASPFSRYTQPNQLSFESYNVSYQYRWQPSEQLQIESELVYIKQRPWNSTGQYQQRLKREAQRWRADLVAIYDYSAVSNLLVGSSYYSESESVTESYLFNPDIRFNGKNSVSNTDHSVFLQFEGETNWANYSLGGRYENHDYSGNHFVPRFALTKLWDKLHTKLVYNEAFKIPQFDTIASAKNAGTALTETEESKTIEFELGYQLSEHLYASGNIYRMEITDYIGFNPITASNTTLGDFSSFGGEFIINWKQEKLDILLSYSMFQIEKTNISTLTIATDNEAVLGIPNHMIKLNSHYAFSSKNSISFNGSLISKRFACITDSNFICGIPQEQKAEYDFDLFYKQQANKLSYQIGIANLFNTDVLYIQPYRGSQSPIPGLSRRLMLDIEYSL